MVTTTLFNQNIWGVSKDRFNYLSFILNMLPKVWSKFASKATIRLRSYMTVFLLCFAFSSSIAQSLPPASSCTSNDLQVVGATLSNVDICSSCTVGTPLTGTLTLSINNTTGSNRTAFAFWGTLEITDGVTGQVTSTPIHGCNSTAIPPNSSALPPHAITSLTFDNINYKCGDILNITNLYLAWTDASPNSVCPLDPSTINPKCGTLPSIQINAGVNATSEITNVSCFGGNNGAIDITAFGGTGSFSYSWSASNGGNVPAGQVNNEDLTGLVAGTYQVTITDANNCQAVKVYTVTQPSGALSLGTCSKTDATCSGNDGSVTAGAVSNAVGTVQYVWKNSSNTVVGNTASVSSLSAGTYYLTVSDDCSSQTCNVTVNAPSTPDAPTLSIVQPTCSDATATITVTSSTTGLLFSFDGGAYAAYPSGGYTTTTTGDHTVSVQNEAGCVSGNATETVNQAPPCGGPIFTYTQGFYHSTGKGCTPDNGSMSALQVMQLSLANMGGTLYLGKSGASFTVTYAQASVLQSIMPGGGKATKLAKDYNLNASSNYPPLKKGRINNVLLSQAITLALNINIPGNALGSFVIQDGYLTTMTPLGSACSGQIASCANGGSMSSMQITTNPALMDLLRGKTVADLLNLASAALGGDLPAHVSYSDISNAVDVINNLFDEGRFSLGYYPTPQTCPSTYDLKALSLINPTTDQTGTESVTVTTNPNPVDNKVTFTIETPVSGHATLDLYDVTGVKLANVYQGQMQKGKQVINYNMQSKLRGMLIYSFKIGDHHVTGKIVRVK